MLLNPFTQLTGTLLQKQPSLTLQIIRVRQITFRAQYRRHLPAMTHATPSGSLSNDAIALHVAVIGAGAAGLVAAKELVAEGHRVTMFEQGDDVGGVWKYTPEVEDDPLGVDPARRRVHSSMYAGLRTNLPREVMAFQDLPFLPFTMQGRSRDSRQFPSHEEVYHYLKAYAATFKLEQLVEFRTTVVRARPVAALQSAAACGAAAARSVPDIAQPSSNGAASLTQNGGSSANGATANGFSAAVGSSSIEPDQQRWQVTTAPAGPPSSRGSEAGGQSTRVFDALLVCNGHFSEPRLPDAAGSADFPGRQMHSHNYRDAGPFAGQRVVVVGAAASGEDIGREIAETAKEVYISSKSWAGAGLPPEGPRGNIRRLPAFLGLTPSGSVLFAHDQEVQHVDTVVYATGYVYSFPFLDGTNIVTVEDNRVGPLYEHIWPPRYSPRLSFVGLPWKVLPFPQYQLQARWISRVLSGRVQLPDAAEMEAHIEAFYKQLEADGIEQRFTHRLDGEKQWQYNQMLVGECGPDVPSLPEWCPQLYEEAGQNRKARPGQYREEALDRNAVQQAHKAAEVLSQSVSCAA